MRLFKVFIVIFLFSFNEIAYAGLFGPSSYEECLLENLKGVNNDSAVFLVKKSCEEKFSNKNENTYQKPKLHELCYVYWNGRGFLKGNTKENEDFSKYKFAFLGVETIVVALPKNMAKELAVDTFADEGRGISNDTKFGAFLLNGHWKKIKGLCGIDF